MLFLRRVGAHPWNSNRSHGAEKVSLCFHGQLHPNVTDLASRGDAGRFPRIIILLSYNNSNSWREDSRRRRRRRRAGVAHLHSRWANACPIRARSPLVNERRRDADTRGNTEIGTFYGFVRFTSETWNLGGTPSSRTRHAFEPRDSPTRRPTVSTSRRVAVCASVNPILRN